MSDIIFIDKDNTIGDFYSGSQGIYEGVEEFLRAQNELGRKIYVATTANNEGRAHLEKIIALFAGYLGREQIDAQTEKYILKDGLIRNVHDDFIPKIRFCSEEERKRLDDEAYERCERRNSFRLGSAEHEKIQEKINSFFAYWNQLLHKETQEPFEENRRYQNPYLEKGRAVMKDLFLARRKIEPKKYNELRTVMIGDGDDIFFPLSDPETPLIVISDRVRCGGWNIPKVMLERLFSTPEMPWQVHDALFSEALPASEGNNREISIEGVLFTLEKGERDERRIYCP